MSHRRIAATGPARAVVALTGGLLAASALIGCGSAQEALTETALEQITGGSIDVDIDNGQVVIGSEEGQITLNSTEDGFSIESGDGESSLSIGGTEVPAAWDDLLDLMPGATVVSAYSASGEGSSMDTVAFSTADDIDAVLEHYTAALTAAGFTETGRYSSGSGDDLSAGATFERGTESVNISAYRNAGLTEASIGLITSG